MKNIVIKSTPLIAYDEALDQMMRMHADRVANKIPDTLWVLQHEAVITKGRRLHEVALKFHPEIEKRGIVVRNADRGGELTYHGPGQIVVYFILKVVDYFEGVSQMVRVYEKVLLAYLQSIGIEARLKEGCPGIWVAQNKVASVGLRVSDGVSRHGISLNINNDLSVYQFFNPCGMQGDCMVNVEALLECSIDHDELNRMMSVLAEQFRTTLIKQNQSRSL